MKNNRGGWCFELNGLFHWLLTQLGFQPELIMAVAKNRFQRDKWDPDFDHAAIVVNINDQQGSRQNFLCDVGWGDGKVKFIFKSGSF